MPQKKKTTKVMEQAEKITKTEFVPQEELGLVRKEESLSLANTALNGVIAALHNLNENKLIDVRKNLTQIQDLLKVIKKLNS